MGFSGGGSNILKAHKHDGTVSQDGGSLDFDNITQGDLTAGDVVYSDGVHLQRLAIGAATNSLVVNGAATAPEWVAGSSSAGKYELVGSFTRTAPASGTLTCSFTAVNQADISHLVIVLNGELSSSSETFYMTFNGLTTSTYSWQTSHVNGGGAHVSSGTAQPQWTHFTGPATVGATLQCIATLSSSPNALGVSCTAITSGVNGGATYYGYNGTASVTSFNEIEFTVSGGNIAVGTKVDIYKVLRT